VVLKPFDDKRPFDVNISMKPIKSYIPFFLTAMVMTFLCIKGGYFGNIGEGGLSLPFHIFGQQDIPAGSFIGLFSITWVCMILLLLFYPRGFDWKKGLFLLLLFGLICRIAILPHEPSDDIYRYLWEGRLISEGVNPYQFAPNHPGLADLANNDPYHPLINHPENSAAYPPLILYLFSAVGLVSYTPLMIKILVVIFDLGSACFLLLLLEKRGLELRWGILYVFNPVILYGFAGQGHFDSIQIFFLLGALYFYEKKWWPIMFLFVGMAAQIKYVAILSLPFLVNRSNLKYLWITLLAIVAPYLPMLDEKWPQFFFSIFKFSEEYAFNGSIHSILRAVFGAIESATWLCKLLFGFALLFGIVYFHPTRNRFRDNPVPGIFFSIGSLIIFSPTIHFWYISWVVPFIALYFRISWIVLTFSISGYFAVYSVFFHTGKWALPVWFQVIEWVPFYLFLIYEIYLFMQRAKVRISGQMPEKVSVIIPVLNEQKHIKNCVESIQKDPSVLEIIVVDGGSTDQTLSILRNLKIKAICHLAIPERGGGRGGQIHAGLIKAKGDILAVVHADTFVKGNEFSNMVKVLKNNPSVIGGAVGSLFNLSGFRMRLIEYANDIRTALSGISFGDQIQFFRRLPVQTQDIYPVIPLMEDVELSLRLKRLGDLVYLFGQSHVSSRRWEKYGNTNLISIIIRFASYLWLRGNKNFSTYAMYCDYYNHIESKERKWKPISHQRVYQNLKK